MNRHQLFIIFTLACLSVAGQQWQWAIQTPTLNNENGNSLASDAFGNIYVAVESGPDYIAKYNSSGTLLWKRTINGNLAVITTDKIGNVYIVGYSASSFQGGNNSDITLNNPSPYFDGFLAKYNSQGDIQWALAIQEPGAYSYVFNVKCDFNGDPIVCGHNVKSLNGGYLVNYYISKYSTFGNLVWTNTSNWKGNLGPTGLATDESGSCYVAGSFSDSAQFNNIVLLGSGQYNFSVFIAKYDNNGNLLWAKKDGTGTYDDCSALSYHKGKLTITGSFLPPSTFGIQALSGPTNQGRHFFVAQYDSAGTFRWARSALRSWGMGVAMDKDDNSFITGSFRSPNALFGTGQGSITLTTQKVDNEIFVAKYDSSGNFNWAIAPTGSYGSSNSADAIVSSNNNYFITGAFSATTCFGPSTLVAPTPTAGTCNRAFIACIKDSSLNLITNLKEVENNFWFSVWPNPVLDYLYIENKTAVRPIKLIIYNLIGEEIYQKNYTTNDNLKEEVLMTDFLPGMYNLELTSQNKKKSFKLIKK